MPSCTIRQTMPANGPSEENLHSKSARRSSDLCVFFTSIIWDCCPSCGHFLWTVLFSFVIYLVIERVRRIIHRVLLNQIHFFFSIGFIWDAASSFIAWLDLFCQLACGPINVSGVIKVS